MNTKQGTKHLDSNLSSFVKWLHEAESTLKYSLWFQNGFSVPKLNKPLSSSCIEKYIDTLFDAIWQDCSNLTYDSNFFGFRPNQEDNDLSILLNNTYFWKQIVKQDCVLFTFVTLRKLIGENIDFTDYQSFQLANFSNTLSQLDDIHHGFDYATTPQNAQKPFYNLKAIDGTHAFSLRMADKHSLAYEDAKYNEPITSSHASNCSRRIRNLYKKLQNCGLKTSFLHLYLHEESDTYINPPSLLEFFDFITERTGPRIGISPIINAHSYNKPFTKSTYCSYIKSITDLLSATNIALIDNTIKCTSDKHKLTLSDKIYLRYQIEKVFAPTSINCLYQNILPTLGTPYSLEAQPTIDVLAAYLKLPNVFTRQYILQMAIDIISKHNDYDYGNSDFFSKKLESPNILVSYARSKYSYINSNTKMDIWQNRFSNMVKYLLQFLFPVFENYFFCAMWNQVNNSLDSPTVANTVQRMYELFRDYLNDIENSQKLFDVFGYIKEHTFENSIKNRNFNTIQPQFTQDAKQVNLDLYKRCLSSHILTFKGEAPITFISQDYLKKITANPEEQIQNLFILDSTHSLTN